MSQTTTPTTAAEVLRAARKLIEQRENWCTRSYARSTNSRREKVPVDHPKAASFCAIGAVHRAGLALSADWVSRAEWALIVSVPVMRGRYARQGRMAVAKFNDRRTTTHADVLALFDAAIARAESEAAP